MVDNCAGGTCWRNPGTGYVEYCQKHEAPIADKAMEVEDLRKKSQRPKPQGGDYRPHYPKREADAYMTQLEIELRDIKSLHADIIEQGRKVQIAASGESKYGAMSAGEYIEWVKEQLERKL